METIILASGSRQRQEYFRLMGLPFESLPSHREEKLNLLLEPRAAVEELAIEKVKSVRELYADREMPWIAGADTIILLDGKIYGKSESRQSARQMLSCFQGRTHEVITAAALFNGRKNTVDCRSHVSAVSFAKMEEEEIEWYLDSGEWEGAAGAYRIQGLASCFIRDIQGSFSSIAGLPLHEFYAMLRSNGYPYGG